MVNPKKQLSNPLEMRGARGVIPIVPGLRRSDSFMRLSSLASKGKVSRESVPPFLRKTSLISSLIGS